MLQENEGIRALAARNLAMNCPLDRQCIFVLNKAASLKG